MKPSIRQKIIFNFFRPFVALFMRIRYGFKTTLDKKLNRPALIVSNHVTQIDPMLLSLSFKQPIYYVVTDNVLYRRRGKLLTWAFNPIPKAKNSIDFSTIKNMIVMAKQGATLGLFVSGNCTYSGTEEYIPSPIAKLIKKLELPLIIYNFVGGYGVSPRWGNSIRKGKFYGYVRRVIEKEEYNNMSDEELENAIKDGLNVTAFDDMDEEGYESDVRAEYLERALFYCPDCHKLETLNSEGNILRCKSCGYEVEYQKDLTFKLLKGKKYFKTVKEWYDFEKDYMSKFDYANTKGSFLKDEDITLIILGQEKEPINGSIEMDKDYLTIRSVDKEINIKLDDITSMSAQSKNNLIFHTQDGYYEIRGNVRRSALVYLFAYYAIKNQKGGIKNGFLGI